VRKLVGAIAGAALAAIAVVLAPVPGAHADDIAPSYQHVWVHYDYMSGYDPTAGKYVSFAPPPAAIQMVVDAFQRHGVILHIDPVHHLIPYHEVVIPDWDPAWAHVTSACTGSDAVSFMALREQYFTPPDGHPWHYAIFAHNVGVPDTVPTGTSCPSDPICGGYMDPTSTGFSALPGLDFVVAFGYIFDSSIPIDVYTWAGTFMHELGHNFGLMHGGVYPGNPQSCMSWKPNYVSVMDYQYQDGIRYSTNGDPNHPTGVRIDYSDEKLLTLNEADLNEPAGVGSVLHPDDIITYCRYGIACTAHAFASGPIDWNLDGNTTDLHAQGDIDNDNNNPNTILYGFDDWGYIHQELQRPPEADGSGQQ
jgi:hypothetical protein